MENLLEVFLRRRRHIREFGANQNAAALRNIILRDIFNRPNPNGPIRPPFNLDLIDPLVVKENFRFLKPDIPRLCHLLRIPAEIITPNRYRASGIEGLCILLKRLAYPNRLCDLELLFQRSASALSEITLYVNNHISRTFGHLLEDINNLIWLNQEKIQLYAQAISNRGAAVQNCFGFIDGTVRPICRPSQDQEEYYSGHKKTHCVKYQAVVCPDGIIVSLLGAYPGRRHDAGIFRLSGFYDQLNRKARFPNGNDFVIYGDQAYGIRELLLAPYPGGGVNLQQAQFNASMKTVREAVEWSFGKTIKEFAFLDFKKNQRLLVQDVETMYKTATILTNCHTCLYGSQINSFFIIEPVRLENYLQLE